MAAPARIIMSKPRKKIAKRQLELRDSLWPALTQDALWSRQTHNGFTTLPKAMPLMMSIMDDLAGGQPVSSTYLELWCRTFDESFVVLSKPREMAFHSGFTGQRAERQWKDRLKILRDLGFIMLEAGPSGEFSYALLLNPYHAIKKLHDAGNSGVRNDKYNALRERAIEIDDESLAPPAPPAPPPPAAIVSAVAGMATPPSSGIPMTFVASPPGTVPPPNPFVQGAPPLTPPAPVTK